MHFVRPRWVFLFFLTMCIVFIAPAITQRDNIGMSMLYVTLFFESICFPTIVALGMRGLGRHTKRGSGFIVGGVLGGACVPPLTGVTADIHGTGMAMVVPMCFFVVAWSYALAVNFVPWYRDCADAFTMTDLGLVERSAADEETGDGDAVRGEVKGHHVVEHDEGTGNGKEGDENPVGTIASEGEA